MDHDENIPRDDGFGPPSLPTLVHCIHCGEAYDSFRIVWKVSRGHDGKPWGHWACPIPGCDGAGFGMDIWPIDPDWIDPDDRGILCGDDEDPEDWDEEDDEREIDQDEADSPDFAPDDEDDIAEFSELEQDPDCPSTSPLFADPEDPGMRF